MYSCATVARIELEGALVVGEGEVELLEVAVRVAEEVLQVGVLWGCAFRSFSRATASFQFFT